jgi:hypothetical protein
MRCLRLIGIAAYAAVTLWAQGGRFEEAKRLALIYIQSEQYDKAAGKLEEVWEQNQSDPAVAENLALAYLNTEDKHSLPDLQKQAFALMDRLAAAGEPVSFIVHHSHEKLAWLQGREWTEYCTGRLSITGKGLTYLADKGKNAARHSFDMPFGAFKASAIELDEEGKGVFHLKTPKGGYVMQVRNRNREESQFLVELVTRRLK